MLDSLKAANKVVGLKQSHRAVKSGKALRAYLAADAEARIAEPFAESCAEAGVELVKVETMALLGEACGVKVGAAVAVELKLIKN